MRIKKTVGSTTTNYRYAGRLLLSEKTGSVTTSYRYDSNANLIAVVIGGVLYFYVKNLQGDVIGMVDTSGNTVVEYTYDSWGNVLSITGSLKDTVGVQNPFRYRGYYYDTETGFYYTVSRYYDANIKRYLSADNLEVLKMEHNNMVQYNICIYCNNNPVNNIDATGECSIVTLITAGISGVINIGSTYISAKITGQGYSALDAMMAFASGAASAFSGILGAAIGGFYTAKAAYNRTKSLGTAALCGTVAFMSTYNIGGLGSITRKILLNESTKQLSVEMINLLSDLAMIQGSNMVSAEVFRGTTYYMCIGYAYGSYGKNGERGVYTMWTDDKRSKIWYEPVN